MSIPESGPLLVQACSDCGHVQLGWLSEVCIECWSQDLQEAASRGPARLLSWVTYHHNYGISGLKLPYTVGWIELPEGPRLAVLVSGDPTTFYAGASVDTSGYSDAKAAYSLADGAPTARGFSAHEFVTSLKS